MEALPVNEAGYFLEDGPPRALDVIELYLQKDGLDFLKQLRSASKNGKLVPFHVQLQDAPLLVHDNPAQKFIERRCRHHQLVWLGLPRLGDMGSRASSIGLIGELRGQFGRSRKLEFRTDAAFFNEKILKRLERSRSEFAIKAPFWPWLGLKEVVAGRKRWHRVSDEIDGFSIKHFIEPWNITVRIAIYRKRVRHRTAKNFQLDLFSPDDGYFEYSAVATNKSLTVQRLWYFAAGRGGQEKTFAELRSQFALDVVPTKSYAANSAWQQLNVLAHNLCRSFQLDTIAETKGFSRKRTCTHLLNTIRTIRFRIFNKAGRLVRVSGRNALRMATNSSTQTLFERIELALAS